MQAQQKNRWNKLYRIVPTQNQIPIQNLYRLQVHNMTYWSSRQGMKLIIIIIINVIRFFPTIVECSKQVPKINRRSIATRRIQPNSLPVQCCQPSLFCSPAVIVFTNAILFLFVFYISISSEQRAGVTFLKLKCTSGWIDL